MDTGTLPLIIRDIPGDQWWWCVVELPNSFAGSIRPPCRPYFRVSRTVVDDPLGSLVRRVVLKERARREVYMGITVSVYVNIFGRRRTEHQLGLGTVNLFNLFDPLGTRRDGKL